MRPTLSELGVYDGTALMEFKTAKHIVYLLNRENTCTYEMDDTPPFPVNQEAVDVAIEQCLMLGCDIVDEVHIARKQYLDGSIPTGFQRTAIVGVSGELPFRGRTLSITHLTRETRELARFAPGSLRAESGGYSLHAATCIAAADREALEHLCRYVAHPPLAQGRLMLRDDGKVIWNLRKP